MDTWIYENRRKWLAFWISEVKGGRPAFEQKYGYGRAQITQFLSETYQDGRSIGDLAARRIEKRLKKPDRSMEVPFEEVTIEATQQKVVKKDDLLYASEIGELVTLYIQATPGWREFILGAARDSADAIANGILRPGADKP